MNKRATDHFFLFSEQLMCIIHPFLLFDGGNKINGQDRIQVDRANNIGFLEKKEEE
ncbi:MAG: hypothetical protein JWQ30_2376 [Sediminibacterium sp.]|nr:hypothetical protein [Sediminibacterium sp.]